MSLEHRPSTAKYPIILEKFIDGGEKAMAIPCGTSYKANYVRKVMTCRYHCKERGVLAISKGGVCYLLNTVGLGA